MLSAWGTTHLATAGSAREHGHAVSKQTRRSVPGVAARVDSARQAYSQQPPLTEFSKAESSPQKVFFVVAVAFSSSAANLRTVANCAQHKRYQATRSATIRAHRLLLTRRVREQTKCLSSFPPFYMRSSDTPCAQRGRTMASSRRRFFEAWVVQMEREKTLVRAEAMQFRIRSLEAEVRRQYAMRRESADRQINVNSRAAARLGLLRSAAPGDLVSAAFWTLKSNWAWSRHCVGRNEGSECVRPGPGHLTAPSSGDLSQDQQRTNRIYEAVRQRTDSRLDHRLT